MKKLFLLLVAVATLNSCKSEDEIRNGKMQTSITTKLKEMLKNPDSFEFVSMNISKSITKAERSDFVNDKKLEQVKALGDAELTNQVQLEYDLMQKVKDNDVVVYYVDFVAKGSNSYGGTIQTKYSATVLNDENYTVTNLGSME